MRILIDLHTQPKDKRFRGSGRYIEGLIQALTKYLPQHQIIMNEDGQFDQKVDIVHYPFFDFFAPTLPLKHPAIPIVTIHDVIPLEYPSYYPKGLKGNLIWQRQKIALSRIAKVITDAPSSVTVISKFTGVGKNWIEAVPLGADSIFSKLLKKDKLSELKLEYKLPDHFVLYVGDANWNKDVETLLLAAQKVIMDVVLVGKVWQKEPSNHPEEKALRSILERFSESRSVHRVGFVPDEDLVGFYQLASVYAQPSIAEGFSFPVLEAMTSGCPVLASDIPVHHDLAQDAVEYVSPLDTEKWARALRKVQMADRADITAKVQEQARKFSWKKTALMMNEIYTDAANSK